eukprot:gene7061-9639_t
MKTTIIAAIAVLCSRYILAGESDSVMSMKINTNTNGIDLEHIDQEILDSLFDNEFQLGSALDSTISQQFKVYREPESISPDEAMVATLTLPKFHKTGLSPSCLSNMCYMFEAALSCKGIGLSLSKICSQYLLGLILSCPMFPPQSDILNAPSVCASEIASVASLIQPTGSPINTLLGIFERTYLIPSFQTNACGRRCYQNWQNLTHSFYYNCNNEMQNIYTARNYSVAKQITVFQEFRNQACTQNTSGSNCFAQLFQISGGSSKNLLNFNLQVSIPSLSPTPINIADYTCNYLNVSSSVYDQSLVNGNLQVSEELCQTFSKMGCCFTNNIQMMQQGQVNNANLHILPPCLHHYLFEHCSANGKQIGTTTPSSKVDYLNFCTEGAITNISSVIAQVNMTKSKLSTGKFEFPNVYNKSDIATFQGVISQTYLLYSFLFGTKPSAAAEPFLFNISYPFQVTVIDYRYYSALGELLTPENGSMAWPPESDYEDASKVELTFQVSIQNANTTAEVSFLKTVLVSGILQLVISNAASYGLPNTVTVLSNPVSASFTKLATPPKNGTSTLSYGFILSILLSFVISFGLVFYN